MPTVTFGHITGVSVGAQFADRRELRIAGVHRQNMAGIAGRAATGGAESIVLNEGYEDDEDRWDEVVYTGEGGRDRNSGRQIADQVLSKGNIALALNHLNGIPVRVVRGPKLESPWAPDDHYRYDGLYLVEDHWHQKGLSGFLVWRYRLVRMADQPVLGIQPAVELAPTGEATPGRRVMTTQRIIRSTEVVNFVKRQHDYRCQMCGIRLETQAGPYAEGAHIRPLGAPHNGPDVPENVLCLCPNHHVLFDAGAILIQDDLALVGVQGVLRVLERHLVRKDHLKYHRDHYSPTTELAAV